MCLQLRSSGSNSSGVIMEFAARSFAVISCSNEVVFGFGWYGQIDGLGDGTPEVTNGACGRFLEGSRKRSSAPLRSIAGSTASVYEQVGCPSARYHPARASGPGIGPHGQGMQRRAWRHPGSSVRLCLPAEACQRRSRFSNGHEARTPDSVHRAEPIITPGPSRAVH